MMEITAEIRALIDKAAVGMELWRENLLSLIGGICSAIIIAWLRWHWEHPDRRDT